MALTWYGSLSFCISYELTVIEQLINILLTILVWLCVLSCLYSFRVLKSPLLRQVPESLMVTLLISLARNLIYYFRSPIHHLEVLTRQIVSHHSFILSHSFAHLTCFVLMLIFHTPSSTWSNHNECEYIIHSPRSPVHLIVVSCGHQPPNIS